MRAFLFLILVLANNLCEAQSSKSFGKGKAIIVLTYDDALQSQLDNVIPALNQAGLKGSFFLDGRVSVHQMKLWKSAADKGHELANHTLYHPCSKQVLANLPPKYQSENYDSNSIIREIGMMNKLLFGIDGKEKRTYAYPCSETSVGGKDYKEALKQSGLIKYARGGGDSSAIITNFKNLDLFNVPSWGLPASTTAEQLTAFVKNVIAKKGIGVFMFHGVGGDYLTVSAKAHSQLIQYLRENTNEVQVSTFRVAMDIVSTMKALQ